MLDEVRIITEEKEEFTLSELDDEVLQQGKSSALALNVRDVRIRQLSIYLTG